MRGFTRELRDWEKEEVARLVNLITNAYALKDDKDDDLRWMAENSGCFSVFSMYRWCENNIQPNDFGVIANMMWHNVSPPRAKSIVWLAWKQKLKTVTFLQKIGVIQGNANNL